MSYADEMQKMKQGAHHWSRPLEILGAIALLILIGWGIYAYLQKVSVDQKPPEVAKEPVIPKSQIMEVMNVRASSTPMTAKEQEKQLNTISGVMSQPASGGSGASGASLEGAMAPATTPAERAKILEAMKQQN